MFRPVTDWRHSWRWLSMHFAALGFVFTSIASALALSSAAAEWSDVLPMWMVLAIAAVIFLLSMLGRLLDQSKTSTTDSPE